MASNSSDGTATIATGDAIGHRQRLQDHDRPDDRPDRPRPRRRSWPSSPTPAWASPTAAATWPSATSPTTTPTSRTSRPRSARATTRRRPRSSPAPSSPPTTARRPTPPTAPPRSAPATPRPPATTARPGSTRAPPAPSTAPGFILNTQVAAVHNVGLGVANTGVNLAVGNVSDNDADLEDQTAEVASDNDGDDGDVTVIAGIITAANNGTASNSSDGSASIATGNAEGRGQPRARPTSARPRTATISGLGGIINTQAADVVNAGVGVANSGLNVAVGNVSDNDADLDQRARIASDNGGDVDDSTVAGTFITATNNGTASNTSDGTANVNTGNADAHRQRLADQAHPGHRRRRLRPRPGAQHPGRWRRQHRPRGRPTAASTSPSATSRQRRGRRAGADLDQEAEIGSGNDFGRRRRRPHRLRPDHGVEQRRGQQHLRRHRPTSSPAGRRARATCPPPSSTRIPDSSVDGARPRDQHPGRRRGQRRRGHRQQRRQRRRRQRLRPDRPAPGPGQERRRRPERPVGSDNDRRRRRHHGRSAPSRPPTPARPATAPTARPRSRPAAPSPPATPRPPTSPRPRAARCRASASSCRTQVGGVANVGVGVANSGVNARRRQRLGQPGQITGDQDAQDADIASDDRPTRRRSRLGPVTAANSGEASNTSDGEACVCTGDAVRQRQRVVHHAHPGPRPLHGLAALVILTEAGGVLNAGVGLANSGLNLAIGNISNNIASTDAGRHHQRCAASRSPWPADGPQRRHGEQQQRWCRQGRPRATPRARATSPRPTSPRRPTSTAPWPCPPSPVARPTPVWVWPTPA